MYPTYFICDITIFGSFFTVEHSQPLGNILQFHTSTCHTHSSIGSFSPNRLKFVIHHQDNWRHLSFDLYPGPAACKISDRILFQWDFSDWCADHPHKVYQKWSICRRGGVLRIFFWLFVQRVWSIREDNILHQVLHADEDRYSHLEQSHVQSIRKCILSVYQDGWADFLSD